MNQNGTGKRAVLYARVSGDDSKYATSGIESQLNDCREYAEQQGYTIVAEHYETPEKQTSGAAWLPEIEKVIKLAQNDAFEVLVVREVDRLARNRFKQMAIEIELEAQSVAVDYVIGQYENSAEGRLLKGLMGEFAEYERQKTRERTQRGRLRSVKAGNVTVGGSKAPYGYTLEEKYGKRKLVVNEDEARIVRLIFDLYAYEGYTLHALVDYLGEHNIPKPAKGNNHKAITTREKWSVGTLSGILNNETYVGRWYYRKTKRVKQRNGHYKRVERPRSEWLLIEVPAIVPKETFKVVAERREANKRKKSKSRKYSYPMSGILTCGHCGKGMSGITRYHTLASGEKRAYRYYKCNARHLPKRYGFKCENPQVKIEMVDGPIWRWVKHYLFDPKALREAWERHREQRLNDAQPLVAVLEANDERLDELKDEKRRLIRAYTSATLTLDDMAEEKMRIDEQINDLSAAIVELRAELQSRLPSADDIETIETYAKRIQRGVDLSDDDPEEQQELYSLLQMEVTLTYEDDEHVADLRCVLGETRLSTANSTT